MKVFCILISLAVLLFVSCASEPEKSTETPAPEKEPEKSVTEVPAPEKELARAKELRDLVVRYELEKIAVQEFNSAENHLKKGEAAYGKDNEAAKASLERAIEGYRAVIKVGYTQISQKLNIPGLNHRNRQLMKSCPQKKSAQLF